MATTPRASLPIPQSCSMASVGREEFFPSGPDMTMRTHATCNSRDSPMCRIAEPFNMGAFTPILGAVITKAPGLALAHSARPVTSRKYPSRKKRCLQVWNIRMRLSGRPTRALIEHHIILLLHLSRYFASFITVYFSKGHTLAV